MNVKKMVLKQLAKLAENTAAKANGESPKTIYHQPPVPEKVRAMKKRS